MAKRLGVCKKRKLVLILALVALEVLVEWVLRPLDLLDLRALVLEIFVKLVYVACEVCHISLIQIEHKVSVEFGIWRLTRHQRAFQ